MSPIDFIAAILATGAIVDVWFNSELFAGPRAAVEAYNEMPDGPPFWARLFSCPYCMSFHIALVCVGSIVGINTFVPAPWVEVAKALFYVLATARGAFVVHALLPQQWGYRRLLTWEEEDDRPDGGGRGEEDATADTDSPTDSGPAT